MVSAPDDWRSIGCAAAPGKAPRDSAQWDRATAPNGTVTSAMYGWAGRAHLRPPGTVSCRQDNNDTRDRSRLLVGRSVISRGGPPMGRGRAKAKQTKVARELKYSSPQTDFTRLQRELSGTS